MDDWNRNEAGPMNSCCKQSRGRHGLKDNKIYDGWTAVLSERKEKRGGLVEESRVGRSIGSRAATIRTSICWASILSGKPSTTPLAVLRRTLWLRRRISGEVQNTA